MLTRRSVPAIEKLLSANSMSAAAASSRMRGNAFALAMTLSAAIHKAEPPTTVQREPVVPMPKATRSVSPSMYLHGRRIEPELYKQREELAQRHLPRRQRQAFVTLRAQV